MGDRRPYPQLNAFRPWVSDELLTRKTSWPTPLVSPFVRLTSCNQDIDPSINYEYFTIGLHGYTDSANIFDITYGRNRDIVGYAYRASAGGRKSKILVDTSMIKYQPPDLSSYKTLPANSIQRQATENRIAQTTEQQQTISALGTHPIPGIISVSIKRSGLANPMIAEVTWQCYNQQQLEFLRHHFLCIGTYVVLEWGHQHSNKQVSKVLDFSTDTITDELVSIITKGRTYVIDTYCEPNKGNYDFIVGQIGNFSIEYDSALNSYRCTTTIVSAGENMWGLTTTTSFVNQRIDPSQTEINRVGNITDYFNGHGSPFENLLSRLLSTPSKCIRPKINEYDTNAESSPELGKVGSNTSNSIFLTWSTLVNDVLTDLISVISTNSTTDNRIKQAIESYKAEIRLLLGLGGLPTNINDSDILERRKKIHDMDWIGNNQYLRTLDPEIMVLITRQLSSLTQASKWKSGGVFGGNSQSVDKGKLTEGIWLNAGMVQDAFLSATTLQQAFSLILDKMNYAVANYWNLKLYYDDEHAMFRIVDHNFMTNDSRSDKFYVFNSNRNDHHNDVLDLSMDSAFPPELITQMMLLSTIQTSSPQQQEALFKEYPLINNTSPFIFAINWTTLKDKLKQKIQATRSTNNTAENSVVELPALGNKSTQVSQPNLLTRLTDITNRAGVTETGQFNLSNAVKKLTTIEKPSWVSTPVSLESFPVDGYGPEAINSKFGLRNEKPHDGVDIAIPVGSAIVAAKSGVVKLAVEDGIRGYGALVVIIHDEGIESYYAHLSEVIVNEGQKVSAGQIIGRSGGKKGDRGSGNSTGPHLHFEIRRNGIPVNPFPNATAQESKSPSHNTTATQPATPTRTPQTPPQTKTEQQQLQEKYTEIQKKYGVDTSVLIAPSESQLISWITQDGYKTLGTSINAFVSPYPTTTSTTLKIQGISGLSISDGFFVDKLPYIFSQYGIFQIINIRDVIATNGWITEIQGYFKFLWPDGKGGSRYE